MEFLKQVLGEELFNQFSEKVNAYNGDEANKDKLIKLVNLNEGDYVSKDKYLTLETDLSGKASELEKANGLIEELKKSTGKDAGLQQKITEYEGEVARLQEENKRLKTESALKFALLSAGAVDVDYLIFKTSEKLKADGKTLELGEDEKIKGIDDLISGLKTQLPTMFASKVKGGFEGFKPLDKDGQPSEQKMTRSDLLKKTYSERMKFYEENPESYREIMKG